MAKNRFFRIFLYAMALVGVICTAYYIFEFSLYAVVETKGSATDKRINRIYDDIKTGHVNQKFIESDVLKGFDKKTIEHEQDFDTTTRLYIKDHPKMTSYTVIGYFKYSCEFYQIIYDKNGTALNLVSMYH